MNDDVELTEMLKSLADDESDDISNIHPKLPVVKSNAEDPSEDEDLKNILFSEKKDNDDNQEFDVKSLYDSSVKELLKNYRKDRSEIDTYIEYLKHMLCKKITKSCCV